MTGGISSEIMGGSFWEGAKIGAIAGAITGAVKGVTTSEQFGNWRAGNGFRSDNVVKAEQARAANMKALLPEAQGADEAMSSARRGGMASEIATASQSEINTLKTGLDAGSLAMGTIGTMTGNPMAGALSISMAAHSTIIGTSTTLGTILNIGGTVVSAVGMFTGNPFLAALGLSMSAHGVLVDYGSNPVAIPTSNPSIEYPAVNYVGNY